MSGIPAAWVEAMAEVVPGVPDGFLATGRMPNVAEHLTHLRREFAGQPELCFLLATTIVHIRRELDLSGHLGRFRQLIDTPETARFLAERLSIRWLVSVADTLADHGDPHEASTALLLVLLVNLVKLCETERRLLTDPRHCEVRLEQLLAAHPSPLFGGLIAYHPRRGDMPRNTFQRLARATSGHVFLASAYCRILAELSMQPTVLSRLAAYNEQFFAAGGSVHG